MKTMSKALAKGAFATVAAGAMAAAAPAAAQDRHHDRDDGLSAGEVIAGAVILGGLAAVILSGDDDDDRRYRDDDRYRDSDYRYRDNDYRSRDRDYRYNDRDYRDDRRGYDRGLNARSAVERCVEAAERRAQRYSGARAEVYEIYDVDRERGGFEVKGRIAVRDGWGNNYRRGNRNDGWEEGRFECDVSRDGRISELDFSGIRGL
ncbi:hypothetical protein [Erythrobacter sp. EC-HK427]|uniref:hypothetical protein n=1 Tax=Erythrobacter sp. EC-HK427 TaxID=2038396 RepID=UPI001254D853|nr:hypothetical protein [Erythrobacter sp. EC-HK427]VVT12535.1 conserved exported hypothetical protein [Erythrobacter sp. EC-HK427]